MEGFWLQAERNLARAVNDFSAGFYDGAVADSLQAAELALKALIMEVTGKAARKTHDLVLLERALSASGRQAIPKRRGRDWAVAGERLDRSALPGRSYRPRAGQRCDRDRGAAGAGRRNGDRAVGEGTTLAVPVAHADQSLLHRFGEAIRARYPGARVLLFGSRARGDDRPDSDYDLMVISEAFAGVSPLWRGHGLHRVWADLGADVDVDILCLTPREYEAARKRPTSWVSEADLDAVPL